MILQNHVVSPPFYRGRRPDNDTDVLPQAINLSGQRQIGLLPQTLELVIIAVEQNADVQNLFVGIAGDDATVVEDFTEQIEGNYLLPRAFPNATVSSIKAVDFSPTIGPVTRVTFFGIISLP